MNFIIPSRTQKSKAIHSRTRMLSLLAVGALVVLGTGAIHAQSVDIPAWVKNTALLWAQGDIGDDVFVGALQFLINEGIITVPNAAPAGTVDNEPAEVERPVVEPVECVLEQEHAQPRTIMDAAGEYAISGGFDESSFNSGDLIRVSYETDAPQDVGIKVGIFNPTGDLICRGTITANDFGIARTTFNLPPYYNIDENLDLIAFFQGEPDRKFTSTTTMKGLKTNLEVDGATIPDTPQTAIIKLSSAVSEDVRLRIFDSNSEILHDEVVRTNDFGTASVDYTVPKYYLEDETISIQASFVDDPDMVERTATSLIERTLVSVTITSDKHSYELGDIILLTITTDPPVTYKDFGIIDHTGNCTPIYIQYQHVVDIIDGVATPEIKISHEYLRCGIVAAFNSGFYAYTFEIP